MDPKKIAQDKMASAQASIDAIFAKADAEQRAASAEELAEVTQLEGEYDTAKAEYAAAVQAEADANAARARSDARRKELNAPQPRRTTPTQPGSHVVIEAVQPDKFKSLGDQLQAIATASLTGRDDNRLHWENITPQAAVTGAGASVPSDGGYLIQKDLMNDLMDKSYTEDEVLSRCRKIPVGPNSDGLKINLVDETSRAVGSRWGGVQVYWGAEADSATSKKPKFRQATWELKDVIGLMYATDRLLNDASALESVFNQAFTEEIRFFVGDAVFNGLGGGQMLGILASNALVSVSKETGQPATTIQFENINKMWSRMWARSRGNAVWFINQDCEPQLDSMNAPAGSSASQMVYLPAGGLSGARFATLKGRPVIPTEFNATLGTVGDIVLADLSQYLIIDKGGVQADSSIHVRFINNEKTFRFIYRVDGQPVWNTTLTPAKGSNTLSPFVALATRA